MDKKLEKRLNILAKGGQLDQDIKEVIEKALEAVEKKFNIQINEDNGAMMVTHLVMSLMRIKKGEDVEGLPQSALEELKSQIYYQDCINICKLLAELSDLKIPEGEKGYITLHLCNLIKQERGN